MQSEFDFACSETGVIDPTAKYLFAALLKREDCVILRELNALRERGWRSATIHSHFKQQRHVADYNKQEGVDTFWLDTMYKSLKSMDCVGRFVRAKRFLDIGCCPGGYSKYIMLTCPEATGMGISLPVESAGHGLAIPQDLLPRIDVVMQDLTNYDLAPRLRKPRTHLLTPIPFQPNSFDFVVCDGHHLRLNTDNIARPWNWTRLLIAQVLLGLRAVSAGGTMFVKLSNVERPLTARILLALYRMSNHVRTIKPRTIHATRGTFYALAQGVRTQSTEYRKLVDGLERLWYVMSFGGEEGYGRGITWEEQEEVTQWEEVMSSQGVLRIVRLGTKVWEIQRDALKGWLQWKGVDVTPNWRG